MTAQNGISETADANDIADSLDQNERVSPVSKPAESGSGWESEPLANFQTDQHGGLILDSSGKPKRRGGKPRKAKPGDKLAGGGVAGDQVEASPTVWTPGQGDSTDETQGETQTTEEKPKLGPAAGKVIADKLFSTAEAIGGEKWKPTKDEREFIETASAETLGGVSLPWWLAMFVGVSLYVVARVVKNKAEQQGAAAHGLDSRGNHRADTERENRPSSQTGPVFPGFGKF